VHPATINNSRQEVIVTDIVVHQFNTTQVRTLIGPDGEPRFVLIDVCRALGITNTRNVSTRLDADMKGVHRVDTPGGAQEVTTITEAGLYEVVLRSDKPDAKAFRRWVTSEVLPSIRKTGAYSLRLEGPELMAAALIEAQKTLEAAQQRAESAEAQIEADKHHVQYSKTLVASNADLLVKQVAGAITAAGEPVGPVSLFEWLRSNGWLCNNRGRLWNNPAHWAVSKGYMRSHVTLVTTSSGSVERVTPLVTTLGQQKLITGFLNGTYKLPDNRPTTKKGN
jgi:anti-repressor protein